MAAPGGLRLAGQLAMQAIHAAYPAVSNHRFCVSYTQRPRRAANQKAR